MSDNLRIVIAAGGTGGHVFPAIAIADAVRERNPDAQIRFVGTRDRMEWKAVPAAGYDITPIWISGFHRRITLKNLLFPLKLLVSLLQSHLLIRKFRPHAIVCCGGFAAGPAGWMAARHGVPVFLQEQNSFPGITNRKLGPLAEIIFTAFDEAEQWFPSGKCVNAGNPVRQNLIERMEDPAFARSAYAHFDLDPDRPVLLVMGGSGGAKSINEAMLRHLKTLHDDDGMQVIWQCGEHYLEAMRSHLEENGVLTDLFPGLRLYGFMDDITEAWAAADVIVSRAGAITCSELMAAGKAGILVPSPWVAGDHQTKNAQALVDQGAAVMLEDGELTTKLPGAIRSLMRDPSLRTKMEENAKRLAKRDAAADIAKQILAHVEQLATVSKFQKMEIKATA